MVFSSFLFLFRFLPLVLLFYYIVPHSFRNFVLFLFSMVFYAWGEPVYILLMIAAILITYTGGRLVDAMKNQGRERAAKISLAVSLILSLSLLLFFKYADFAISTINSLTGAGIALLKLALPIGISFYTFQSMSYVIDIYRGDAQVQKNLITYSTYVVMFPQLIAGPIVRYKTIDKQLRSRKETLEEFAEGVQRFLIGLGKKVLLANTAGALWESISAMTVTELPVLTAWLGIFAYTFQIYFDFSGYSDMAIGLGHMFGFTFLENFNYPYISKSITEFWRRWHISLSTWFKEYVYIPLGGNRVRPARHIFNLLFVWLLTGFWHGASWNFVLWGLYYGVLLVLEKYVYGKYLEKLPSVVQHIYSILLVAIGWEIFVFTDFSEGMNFLRALFGGFGAGFINSQTIYLLLNNAVLLILLIVGCTRVPAGIAASLSKRLKDRQPLMTAIKVLFFLAIFVLSIAWLVDASYNPFLYFRF